MMREQGGDVVVTESWDGKVTVALWLRPAPEAPLSVTIPSPSTPASNQPRASAVTLGPAS
jgi:hypothetical protein